MKEPNDIVARRRFRISRAASAVLPINFGITDPFAGESSSLFNLRREDRRTPNWADTLAPNITDNDVIGRQLHADSVAFNQGRTQL
jgi:hypothetical protein